VVALARPSSNGEGIIALTTTKINKIEGTPHIDLIDGQWRIV
jgi:hypothetical protein